MEKILATKNNKVFDAFTSNKSVRDESKQTVHLEIPEFRKRYHQGSRRNCQPVLKSCKRGGILINRFHNHEQLLVELRGVETFGLDNFDIFKDVKMEIEEHCRSKAKYVYLYTHNEDGKTSNSLIA